MPSLEYIRYVRPVRVYFTCAIPTHALHCAMQMREPRIHERYAASSCGRMMMLARNQASFLAKLAPACLTSLWSMRGCLAGWADGDVVSSPVLGRCAIGGL